MHPYMQTSSDQKLKNHRQFQSTNVLCQDIEKFAFSNILFVGKLIHCSSMKAYSFNESYPRRYNSSKVFNSPILFKSSLFQGITSLRIYIVKIMKLFDALWKLTQGSTPLKIQLSKTFQASNASRKYFQGSTSFKI